MGRRMQELVAHAEGAGDSPPPREALCLRWVFLDTFFPDGVTEKPRLSSRDARADTGDLGGGTRARGPGGAEIAVTAGGREEGGRHVSWQPC